MDITEMMEKKVNEDSNFQALLTHVEEQLSQFVQNGIAVTSKGATLSTDLHKLDLTPEYKGSYGVELSVNCLGRCWFQSFGTFSNAVVQLKFRVCPKFGKLGAAATEDQSKYWNLPVYDERSVRLHDLAVPVDKYLDGGSVGKYVCASIFKDKDAPTEAKGKDDIWGTLPSLGALYHQPVGDEFFKLVNTSDDQVAPHCHLDLALPSSHVGYLAVSERGNHRIQFLNPDDGTGKRMFGMKGPDNGCFAGPRGIASDYSNRLVVADRNNHRIQCFNVSDGKFSSTFGEHGSAEGQLDEPFGIAVDSFNRIIVSEFGNNRVSVFDHNGKFIFCFGSHGSNNGQFVRPRGLAVSPNDDIVVADTGNARVQIFDNQGRFKATLGQTLHKALEGPEGVACDAKGRTIVSDYDNHRVVVFDIDGSPALTFGTKGTGDGQFKGPTGVTASPDGRIFVSDFDESRISAFDSSGEFLFVTGSKGTQAMQFNKPGFVAYI
jgi:DNA-binding beta-propeller fold protein YncE